MSTPHKNRIDHIDSIRGIAALLVAFLHITGIYTEEPAVKAQGTLLYDIASQLNFGVVGVVAFFVISGFVICPSLKGSRDEGARKFLLSRFFRLYPAFWTSMILVLLVSFVGSQNAIDIRQVLGNIPMLYTLFHVEPLEGLYWTLEVELIFYFLCLALFLSGGLHKPLILFLVALFLMAVNQWIFSRPDLHAEIGDALSMHWVLMPWHLAIMFWGGLFRMWYDDRRKRFSLGSLSIPVSALVLTLLLIILWRPISLSGTWIVEGKFWALTRMVPYILGMGLFIVGALYIQLNNRFLVWLGAISYSIYLLHPVVALALLEMINTHFPQWGNFHLSVYLLVCIPLTIVLAGLVYYCVEKPAIGIGRHLQSR